MMPRWNFELARRRQRSHSNLHLSFFLSITGGQNLRRVEEERTLGKCVDHLDIGSR